MVDSWGVNPVGSVLSECSTGPLSTGWAVRGTAVAASLSCPIPRRWQCANACRSITRTVGMTRPPTLDSETGDTIDSPVSHQVAGFRPFDAYVKCRLPPIWSPDQTAILEFAPGDEISCRNSAGNRGNLARTCVSKTPPNQRNRHRDGVFEFVSFCRAIMWRRQTCLDRWRHYPQSKGEDATIPATWLVGVRPAASPENGWAVFRHMSSSVDTHSILHPGSCRLTSREHPWREVALSDEEYAQIVELLGREPRPVELGMFGAM